MRHGVKHNRLNRNTDHRRALLNNLATSVLKKGLEDEVMKRQVRTTVVKAKVVRGLVERLITYAKKGDLSARRQAAKFVKEPAVLQGLFDIIGKRYAKRAGGYTRVLKLGEPRKGDNADMAVIMLVEDEVRTKAKKAPSKASKAAKAAKSKKVNITQAEAKKAADSANEAIATQGDAKAE
jgi:large subunit ribosomal protein L17